MEIARGQFGPVFIPSRQSVRAFEAAQLAMLRLLSPAKDWADTIVKVRSRSQPILIGFTLAPFHLEALP